MRDVTQSSTQEPLIFLLVDSTDHVTPETGITPTVTLSKNGGSFASPSGAVTEIGNGWYKVAANATDTNTLGPLIVHATGTGCDPTDVVYSIVSYNPQDTVRLGLTALPNVASGSAGAVITSGTGTAQLNVSGGRGDANVLRWLGTACATPTVAGVPEVDVTHLNGATAGLVNLNRWFDGTTGFATASNDFSITGDFTVGTFNVTATFSVVGDFVLGAEFSVAGATTFTGAITGTNASNNLRINGVAPGASGGLLISGSNSGTTTLGALTVSGATTFTGAVTGSNASNNFSLGTTPNVAVAAAVWDRVLTAANHNITNSAGRRLRQLGASTITGGTAQAGASNSITLAAGESSTNEIFDSNLIVIVGGTGAGQARIIVEYNGTTKVATVDEVWVVTPDNTSEYEMIAASQESIAHHGLAQAGGATSITLASTASATDDIYNGSIVFLSTSTGTGQARLITDYNGTTKVATVSPAWAINPGSNSVYKIIPGGSVIVDSGTVTTVTGAVGSVTGNVGGNVVGSVASVTGAVGSVTGNVGGNVTGSVGSVASGIPSAATIADAVWDEAQSGHVSAGTFGLYLDAKVSEAGGGGLTAGGIADAVWDELLSGHAIAGSSGQALSSAGGAADPLLNTVPGAYAAGTAGYALGAIDDIQTKTDLITTGSVTITSPVNAAGDAIELFRGDDYKNADSRAITFTGITNCPVLTGGTVLLKIGSSISQAGTVTAADACRFDLTSAQTAALARSSEPFEVQATLVTSGNVVTIATGTVTITGQI